MFSFRRKKIIRENEDSIQEMEKIVHELDKDGTGRIRVKDLEAALQRIDEDSRSKPERKTQVRTFSE
jgi:Ca2+-binding EF-hand superfamily protein